MVKSTFRNNRSTFNCINCGRLTRETEDNDGLECYVRCFVCGARGPLRTTWKEAQEAWNKRPGCR